MWSALEYFARAKHFEIPHGWDTCICTDWNGFFFLDTVFQLYCFFGVEQTHHIYGYYGKDIWMIFNTTHLHTIIDRLR